MAKKLLRLLFLLLLTYVPSHAQVTDTAKHADDTLIFRTPVIDTPSIDTSGLIVREKEKLKEPVLRGGPENGYIIHGRVTDAGTGEGIPFATVHFPHSGVGKPADLDGNFILQTKTLPSDTLVVEAIGYKPARKVLKKDRYEYNYILELERSLTSLDEVTIHAGEDPAIVLVKKILEKKPQNDPDRTENYSYEAYNRLEADLQRLTKEQFEKMPLLKSYSFIYNNLDTVSESKPYLPLYLTETISDYYFRRKPKKAREVIKASMVKGVNNENVVRYLGTFHQSLNVYKNYVPVFDKKFVSPISDDALFFYKYKIKDTQVAYGHNIILVQYSPKRPIENCFTGDFWVVDSIYAIQRVSMEIAKEVNVNWLENVALYQEFAPVDSFWFCTKDKFIAGFSAFKSKKLPGVIGRKTTTYHHIRINQDTIDKVLDNPEVKQDVIALDSAKRKSDDWWKNNRPDTLTKNEVAIYKMVDTINSMPLTTVYKNGIDFLSTGVKDFGPIQLGPYFYLYSRNVIEGNRFRLTIGTPRSLKDLHFTGYVAYGTRDDRFKYGFTGLWMINRQPWTYLEALYSHDVSQTTNYYDQLGADNIFSTIFRKRGIPWKLAFTKDARIQFYKQYFNGFSHKLILERRDFTPFDPLPQEGIFYDVNGRMSRNVVSSEVGVDLRFAYKEKYLEGQFKRVTVKSKYPVVSLSVTTGIKGVLDGAYSYQKARFAITGFNYIPPLGNLYYNVFAGKYFGTLPYPLLEIHPGNEYYYYNMYAFQMMNNYEFLSDEYVGFNTEHNFGGGIFNRIPVLKKLKFRQFWTAKGVVGTLSSANQALNMEKGYPFRMLKGSPYLELGTGVSNILQVGRIDFVWRVTPQPLASEAKWRYFGIFGSVKFEF
ncbi:MAG: carboxypeptidase-like regulatory domain-containing protein [Taibaiella sp.]|nr:carboxypeptidase-like regulatory domain-containing protein [Taibaiella sp.]